MRRFFLVALSVAALAVTLGISAQAQQPPAGTQAGLKIAPTTYEATLNPGQAKDGVVDVFNLSPGPIVVEPRVENVRMIGDAGDLEFFLGDSPFRLDPYIQLDRAAFTLGKGEARRVPFRVMLPVGSPPGGYFGAVLFRTAPTLTTPGGTSVKQSGQVGTVLILTVAGDADRQGTIKQIDVDHSIASKTVSADITYANTGNTDEPPLGLAYKPRGSLTVKDVFGRTVADQQLEGNVVFPGSQRKFTAQISKDFWFGPYTLEVELNPGSGQASTSKVTYWAVSWPSLGVIGLAAALVLGYLWVRRRKRTP